MKLIKFMKRKDLIKYIEVRLINSFKSKIMQTVNQAKLYTVYRD